MTDQRSGAKRSVWRTVLQLGRSALIVGVFVACGTAINARLARYPIYDASDSPGFDLLMQSFGTPDSLSDDVTLVTIDNDDYRTKFGSKSPLDKQTLVDIIHAIVEFKPAVLGIAVDTGEWQPPIPALSTKPVRLVWAATRSARGDYELDWAKNPAPNEPRPCTAVPLFYPEDDGTIRTQVERVTGRGHTRLSFPVALRRSFDSPTWNAEECAQPMPASGKESPSYIQFAGTHHQFTRFSATDLLAAAGPNAHKPQHMKTALENGVVILGGTYDAARDRHPTPVGDKDGVEILAHAFESLDRPVASSLYVTALWEFGIACVALVAFHFIKMRPLPKALLATAVPFFLAFPVRFILFQYGSYVGVIVSLFSIPFHQYAEFFESRYEKRTAKSHRDAEKTPKAERRARAEDDDRDRSDPDIRVRLGSARGPSSGIRGRRR